MPTLQIPGLMKFYVENQKQVSLEGSTVSEVLSNLCKGYPQIKPHIMDSNGNLRRYVNLFINDTNIKDLNNLESIVLENDIIILLPSISGG